MNFINEKINNPEILHEGRLQPRATVVPSLKKDVYYKNKEESELITVLNGDYRFAYEPCDCLEDFWSESLDDSEWNTIDVPSMWQYRGYGKPTYPNVKYPFAFHPPYVPHENPVGYYRKKFHAVKSGRSILYFGGVDNAFFVYLNGEYVGFSKGSRLPAEFDVTGKIRNGENLLAVKVFTYSDATYLENQDMLMANGIFRDVLLLSLSEVSVFDYHITAKNNVIAFDITLEGQDFKNCSVQVEAGGKRAECPACRQVHLECTIEDIKEWNAETPYLYNTYITLKRDGKACEIHSKKIGFAQYRVDGNRLLLNETPITIKGINRHEHDPKNGRAISVSLIEKELRLIKEHNMNAIRCAHYPNHPAFYELCSELGIYVMDEGDIETHGCGQTGDQGFLAKAPSWNRAFLERTERITERNKNETCIMIRSIGNEHGCGKNINDCIRYIKKRLGDVPVFHTVDSPRDPQMCDFRQDGYFKMESLTSFPEEGKPVIVSEYGHAMGNSPGLMADSWDYIYRHRQIAGGFVWEYKNHGFYDEDAQGNVFYRYGGDFGDVTNHWSNFSMDGYCLSDGTPKPSMTECKHVLSPCYTEWENGKIKITNTNDFRSLDYITVEWEILEDFEVIKSGRESLGQIKPYESEYLNIDFSVREEKSGARYYINLRFKDESGFEISARQHEIMTIEKAPYIAEEFPVRVTEEKNILAVEGETFRVVFDKGVLCRYEVDGKTLIDAPMKLNFYRAPIDNDGVVGLAPRRIKAWEEAGFPYFTFFAAGSEVCKREDFVVVKVSGRCAPAGTFAGFNVEIIYRIGKDGLILVEYAGTPYGRLGDAMPRIGVCFQTGKEFDRIQWYGRGFDECYCDRKAHCPVGLYEASVDALNFIYDIPQECGTRCDVGFVMLRGRDSAFTVIGSDQFAFSYHPFALGDLEKARHRNELPESDCNYLYLDYRMRGLGSASCGPEPEECYELRPHAFRFVFAVCGETDTQKALSLLRQDLGKKTEALSDSYHFVALEETPSNVECEINMF